MLVPLSVNSSFLLTVFLLLNPAAWNSMMFFSPRPKKAPYLIHFVLAVAIGQFSFVRPTCAFSIDDFLPIRRKAPIDLSALFLSDQKIELDSYLAPNERAYSGSIAAFEDGYALACRIETHTGRSPPDMDVAMVALDSNFRPTGPLRRLETRTRSGIVPTAEDPRLFRYRDALWVVYNATQDGAMWSRRSIHLARVASFKNNLGETRFTLAERHRLWFAKDGAFSFIEKNWTPFVRADAIHLIYETNPPLVLEVPSYQLNGTNQDIVLSPASRSYAAASCGFGQMRGGTPALYDTKRQLFYSFFHCGKVADFGQGEGVGLYYLMGLYSFSPVPPYDIRNVSQEPIIPPLQQIARSYQRERFVLGGHRAELRVMYPTGYVVDGNDLIVSYGYDNQSTRVVRFDRERTFDWLAQQPNHLL